MEENKPENSLEDNSLENPATGGTPAPSSSTPSTGGKKSKKRFSGGLKGFASRLNIYLLLFILIVVLAGFVVFIGFQRSKKELSSPTINTTPLDQEALDQLNGSDASVGDPKQTLSVESNAIFSGTVLVKGGLEVAGAIKVGGPLNLPGITVSGSSNFDQIAANELSVAGDTTIQGAANIQGNLTVGGSAQFGGPISAPQISVGSFVVEGDLAISRHIDAGGGTPGLTNGNALGSGGTASVSGTDTSGTVAVNTGGGPGAGCFATISFRSQFSATPHVVITPVGAAAAGLNYYVTRNTGSFQICSTNAAPAGANFAFDYVVID